MNDDDFLSHYRKPPRPEFAAALYERITHPMDTQQKRGPLRRLALVTATLVAICSATLLFSPAARAAVSDLIREIGGVAYLEMSELPFTPVSDDAIPSESMTLEQARTTAPFSFNIPNWVPEGFTRRDEVQFSDLQLAKKVDESQSGDVQSADIQLSSVQESRYYMIRAQWGKPISNGETITINLTIGHGTRSNPNGPNMLVPVGPNAVETVSINGQPAGLARGSWKPETKQWTNDGRISLTWDKDNVTYTLSGPAELEQDLIHMAESIP